MSETWLSIVGGGLAAAIVTLGFNVWWDKQKERSAQDWEYNRANLIHIAAFGLMETFFAAKTEIEYLVGALSTLETTLRQLSVQAEAIVREQGGPELKVAELESRRDGILARFREYDRQQADLRWNQYEQKVKDLEAKAQTHLSTLQPLIPQVLHTAAVGLFNRLSADYEWSLPNARERLSLFTGDRDLFLEIHKQLLAAIEKQLGRK
jgi:hypothetical protein